MLVAPVVIAWPMMIIFWCRLTRCSPIGTQEACADCCNIMYVGWCHQRACLEPHETLPPLLASSTHPALSALYVFLTFSSPVISRRLLLLLTLSVCILRLWDKVLEWNAIPQRKHFYFYWRGKNWLCLSVYSSVYEALKSNVTWHVRVLGRYKPVLAVYMFSNEEIWTVFPVGRTALNCSGIFPSSPQLAVCIWGKCWETLVSVGMEQNRPDFSLGDH